MNPGHDGEHRLGSACFRLCMFFAANPTRRLDSCEVVALVGEHRPYLLETGNLTHALRKAVVTGWIAKQPSRGPGNRAVYAAGPELLKVIGRG